MSIVCQLSSSFFVNCTTDHNFGYRKFTFYTFVHTCNMCLHVYLLVIAVFSLHLIAVCMRYQLILSDYTSM